MSVKNGCEVKYGEKLHNCHIEQSISVKETTLGAKITISSIFAMSIFKL